MHRPVTKGMNGRKNAAPYEHAAPFTKESLLYREIFEKYYPGQSEMVVDFWMPNKGVGTDAMSMIRPHVYWQTMATVENRRS